MTTGIAERYDGRSVFLTGATGFIGKVVLEKLLYSCPGLDKVYILVRDKKNISAQQRIVNILEKPIFSRLKIENSRALEKIVIIKGDIAEPQMGINTEDEACLLDKVSIVFHIAANIKFKQTLEEAMNVNVMGTKRVLELSQRMKNIKTFVYISTAYANSACEVIEEIIYPTPASLNEVNKVLLNGTTEKEIKHLIGQHPNVYTFTKAITENMIVENHGHVPVVIVRPTIVASSIMEPIMGWVDNWYGASGFIASSMKGLNHIMLARPINVLDLTPVDYVSNLSILAAVSCERSNEVSIYHSSTSADNPLTLIHLRKLVKHYCIKNFNHEAYMAFTEYKWVVTFMTLLQQRIPAYFMDMFLWIRGKKPRYVNIQTLVALGRDTLEYFTSHNWTIKATNTKELFNSLSPSDQKIFPCDPANINWDDYTEIYFNGIQQFLLKTLTLDPHIV